MSTSRGVRLAVGFVVVILLLAVNAVPSHAWSRGGGGGGSWHGGGGGRHGGGSSHGGGGSWHGGGHRGFHHGFQHHHGFRGHHFGGSRVFFGVGLGVPFLYPYAYPYYSYPYAYPYPAPVVVESTPPVYVQQNPEPTAGYWYYCSSSQAYYPNVTDCPEAWIQVAPQSSQPTR